MIILITKKNVQKGIAGSWFDLSLFRLSELS